MDYSAHFELDSATLVCWTLQLALIAWCLSDAPRRIALPRAALATGLVAIAAGWVWRLAYSFVLASGGFRLWVGDDAVRWLRAWQWSRDPFLLMPEDLRLVGPYVLLGSLMSLPGDPVVAMRLLAAMLSVLPLIGVFVLSLALRGQVSLGIACVAIVAPHWLHILLGTGAMTELPVSGLLLIGLALQLQARAHPKRRALAWWGAGCLALATSLDLVGWLAVIVIEAGLLVAVLRSGKRGFYDWLGPAALAGSFCVFWLGAQWIATGSPLSQFAEIWNNPLFRYGHPGDLMGNAGIYPAALLYASWSIAPLLLFGWVRSLLPGANEQERGIALGVLAGLLLLVATSVGGTNITPFRSCMPLFAFLVPISVSAVFRESDTLEAGPRKQRVLIGGVLTAMAFGSMVFVQHHKVFERRHLEDVAWTRPGTVMPLTLDLSDTFVLGAKLRREFLGRIRLTEANLSQPIRLYVGATHDLSWFEWLFLQYAIGDPGRVASPVRSYYEVPDLREEIRELRPNQLLISSEPTFDRRVREIFRIGRYTLYEGRP